MIIFLDSFAKPMQIHVNIGAEFWVCITDAEFHDKSGMYPFHQNSMFGYTADCTSCKMPG